MASDLDAAPAAALHAQGRDLLLGALANPGVLGSTNAATSTSTGIRASAAGPVDDLLASAADAGASAAAFAHEVHWEGYVRKKGDWLPRWEERYLILDGAALTYYNSKDEARSGRNLRGRMQLSRVRPENYGKAHGFLIETRGHKSFHLCCTTELEKDMWVEMMQAAIDDHDAAHGNAVLTSRHRGVSAGSVDLGSATSSAAGGSVGGTVAPSPPPTQVDLRSFYFAFRQLLISHSSSPQFFPKLARDVVLSSNYAPTVPFWGEYHGLDGVLHFFSILYETVELTAFFVTDIAQAQEGSTAVVAGRETMKNRDNGRKFTQQWQHTIEFAPDGRVKSLTITADPVAASAVFGCNATSSLSLPTVAAVGTSGGSYSTSAGASNASHADNPAGTLRVVVFRGEQISNRNAYAGTDDDEEASYDSGTEDDDGEGDAATAGGDAATDEEHPHRHPHGSSRVFLGLRLLTDGKTNVYAPTSSAGCLARTPACDASQVPDPKWNSTHDLPFAGLARGKPCFMLIEAWQVRENPATPGADAEEIIGVAKVNLAPFLALASSSRTVRESVIHTDIARGAVPQWYTLLSAHETKFTCGRVQLSISFEAAKTGHHGNGHGATVNGGVKSASEIAADPNAPSQQIHAGSGNGTSSVAVAVPAPSAFSSQRVALARGHSFRDMKRDNHQFRVGNTNFDVPRRYQMIKAVGQGAYGCVIAASDTETGQALAIKNIPNAFNDLIDAKRILREIRLMRHLNHPNLVNLLDLIRPPSLQEFNDVYIVSELMETDLHRVIHSNQSISDDHIQYFLYQMLLAIHYVHSAQVLHRDLKPSNVLVNSDCDLKLCDFGLARGVHGLDSGLTEYVVTRWYRAPELLLSSKYDKQMDVWAIGCILAEMLGRRPLFPGHDYLHQLKIIMDVIGSPAEDSLDFITNPKAKRFILRQPKKPKVPLASVYPRATPQCLDLLDKMLVFDPRKRITIAEALEHPYLSLVRDKSLERTCPTPFDFAFENTELTKQKLQELIFEDVCAFHPDARIPDQGLTQSPPGSVGSSSSRFIGSASSSANGSARPVVSASNGSAASVPVAAPVRVQPAQVSATSAVAPAVSAESSAETRPAPVVLLPPNSVASSSAPASAAPAPVSAASAPVSAVSAAPPAPVVLLSPSTLPAVAATTSSESAPVSATATSTAAVAPQPTVQRTTSPLNEVALDIRDSVAETPRALGSAATPSPPASASVVAPALTLAPVLTLAPTPSREPAEDMSDAAMDAALEAIGSAGIHNVAVSSTASSASPAVVKDEAQPATDEATTNGSSSADSSRADPTEATGRRESSAGAEIDLAASPTKRLLHPPHAAALTPSSVV